MSTPTLTSTKAKSRLLSAPTDLPIAVSLAPQFQKTVFGKIPPFFLGTALCTNRWRAGTPRLKLSRMISLPATSSAIRVLGIDPAAAGPTGYGIVESEGRNCRMLHYGALRVADKLRKESAGAALEAVHALICQLIRDFSPHALAVA